MSEKVRMMTVLLVDDLEVEHAQRVADAIKMLVNVRDVQLGDLVEPLQAIARDEAKRDLGDTIIAVTRAMTYGFQSDADKKMTGTVREAVAAWKSKRRYGG